MEVPNIIVDGLVISKVGKMRLVHLWVNYKKGMMMSKTKVNKSKPCPG